MGIISRFADIMSANFNALLDKAEDPEKMIDQYLSNAKKQYAKVKEETAGVMAEEKRCKDMLDDITGEVVQYDQLTRKALAAGEEGEARILLAKKQQLEGKLAGIQETYQVAKANADKIRQMHDKLKSDIQELESRRQNIKATIAVAKTQDKINKANDVLGGARGSIAAFNRMEEKADEMLRRATATAELDSEPVDEAEELAKKYAKGGSSASVDAELEKMKAEMGM